MLAQCYFMRFSFIYSWFRLLSKSGHNNDGKNNDNNDNNDDNNTINDVDSDNNDVNCFI